jgi:hypothetical protein
MTDQDRGAYAPQNDAPLAFDPRRAARRGPAPVTLVVSIIVLGALVFGGFLLYRHGARQPGEAPQVVGTPVGDFKTAPTSSEAPSDSSASLQIYKTEVPPAGENTPTPSFTHGPEQPQARPIAHPAPPPPPVSATALRPAEPAPTVVAQNAAPSAAKTPPPMTKTAPAPKAAPPPPKAAPPAKTLVAKLAPPPPKAPPAKLPPPPPPAPAAAAATSGGAVVQIGALSSPALADKALSEVAGQMGGAMAGKTRRVEATSKDGKTFYRADLGGFADHAAASSFCASLKAKGGSCIVR